jgi:hypothetical protein
MVEKSQEKFIQEKAPAAGRGRGFRRFLDEETLEFLWVFP